MEITNLEDAQSFKENILWADDVHVRRHTRIIHALCLKYTILCMAVVAI